MDLYIYITSIEIGRTGAWIDDKVFSDAFM